MIGRLIFDSLFLLIYKVNNSGKSAENRTEKLKVFLVNLAVCDSDCLTDGFTDIADKSKRIKKNHIHPTGGVTSSNVC